MRSHCRTADWSLAGIKTQCICVLIQSHPAWIWMSACPFWTKGYTMLRILSEQVSLSKFSLWKWEQELFSNYHLQCEWLTSIHLENAKVWIKRFSFCCQRDKFNVSELHTYQFFPFCKSNSSCCLHLTISLWPLYVVMLVISLWQNTCCCLP